MIKIKLLSEKKITQKQERLVAYKIKDLILNKINYSFTIDTTKRV